MQSVLTKLAGAGVLAFNSVLAIRNSSRSSVAFVLAANTTLLLLLLLFLCIRKLERARGGQQGGDGGAIINNMGTQYAGLAKLLGLAVLMCSTALDAYDARRDQLGSSAFVLVSYVVFVILTGLFIRAFSRAHAGGEPGQED